MSREIEPLPSRELLERMLEAWGLRDLVFVRKMENIVFSAKSAIGTVYLRLTTPLRRARPEIEAEIHWLEHLAEWGIQVPQIVPSREGQKIVSFVEGDQRFEVVVFSEMKGEHPSEEMVVRPEFLRTLGSLIAKMHCASERYEAWHQGMKREEWFEERGLRHALAAATVSKSPLGDRLKEAISWMQRLPITAKNYGLIHADLGALNLFIEEDSSIGIIDFDDSCYHWFIFDLALVMASMAMRFQHETYRPEEAIWRQHLIEGYQAVRPLSPEEIAWIPRFIDFIFLRIIFWIEHHQSLHTFHEDAIEKVDQRKRSVIKRILSHKG